MSDLPTISFRQPISSVEKLGFEKVRQRGSHIRYRHPDGRLTTIPDHGRQDVPKGLCLRLYDMIWK
jgi:predicted RNA binding protein YcfA (HicA-like mRNA interferase family)